MTPSLPGRRALAAKFACAAALALAAPATSHAATYALGVITDIAGASQAVSDDNSHGAYGTPTGNSLNATDFFTFTVASAYSTTAGAQIYIKEPAANNDVKFTDLTLFSGLCCSGFQIATTGLQAVAQTPGSPSFSLTADLLPSTPYYLEVGNQIPNGDIGDYSVSIFAEPSAVPEPATWALLIAGVGVVGGALRAGRRQLRAVAA